MSDISTLCSNNTKEIEEAKSNYFINCKNNKLYKSLSAKKAFKLNVILCFNTDISKKKKKYNSTSKFKTTIQLYNINIKKDLKIKGIRKNNYIEKEGGIQYYHINKCNININNKSKPIKAILKNNDNIYKKNVSKKKIELMKNDYFNQNKDITCMKGKMIKIPELFNNEFNLQKENISNIYNKTFGKLNKEIIPISFYNHVMFNENINNIMNKNKNYFKTSITERNKKKLLTIIYYSPKLNVNE